MRSLADVFRWTALPAAKRQTFLDAATMLLEHDPEIKKLTPRKRSALLQGDMEDPKHEVQIIARLNRAVVDLVQEIEAAGWLQQNIPAATTHRVLAAAVIAKALRGVSDLPTLDAAATLLYRLQKQSSTERNREHGRAGQAMKDGQKRLDREAKLKLLQMAAAVLRREKPALKTKSQRAKWLLKHGFRDSAPNPKALIELARRNGFEI